MVFPEQLCNDVSNCAAARICVAFSGGADSTALLHALAQLPDARNRGLRALHVDHGLQRDSSRWADLCLTFCAELELPCEVLRVQVDTDSGEGLESAARRARYNAMAGRMQPGEWLLLAHHRDDQAETVVMKLLRGAGPDGLGGMRVRRPFHQGQLWRPLLDVPQAQLRRYVEQHRLRFIEDPSNQDQSLGRNRLRHEIMPRLVAHWPQAMDSILRSAALSRAAADTLRHQWLAALPALRDPADNSLDADGWLALDPALRGPLLDHWLHRAGLTAPTHAQRLQIERQCHARPGQVPCIRWPGTALHIWRGRLWAEAPTASPAPDWHARWFGEMLLLPGGSHLSLCGAKARLDAPLTVRLRQGGERIKPAGDRHTRELRDLFQQAAVPPWQRNRIPLLYADDELITVADRWISDRGVRLFQQAGGTLRWQTTPERRENTERA